MSYRAHLPQLDGGTFLTDGGLETTLIFHEGVDLPAFAAFVLLEDDDGTAALRRYFAQYAQIASDHGLGLVLESPTWRANPRWGAEVGYTEAQVDELNRKAVALMEEIRAGQDPEGAPIVISGCIGPHDDGYNPSSTLTAAAAQDYHATQIATFRDTGVDMVTAITMTYVDEAVGIARAAQDADLPVAISFTVETDGRLPSGEALGEAITQVDADAGASPAYYMVNCAHPTHFEDALRAGGQWRERIRGLRPNASTCSHAELDEATELDEGDPADLGTRVAALREWLPNLNVIGGCCGTDHRHVDAMVGGFSSA